MDIRSGRPSCKYPASVFNNLQSESQLNSVSRAVHGCHLRRLEKRNAPLHSITVSSLSPSTGGAWETAGNFFKFNFRCKSLPKINSSPGNTEHGTTGVPVRLRRDAGQRDQNTRCPGKNRTGGNPVESGFPPT